VADGGLVSGGSGDVTAAGSDLGTGGFRDLPVTSGQVLAARYEVRRFLGRGGMGVVFAAYDRTLGEHVAVKILRPELSGERRWAERLAREVKLARQIQHPNVCRMFDFVQADGQVFIVMELARQSLRAERAGSVDRDPLEEGSSLQEGGRDGSSQGQRGGLETLGERLGDARSIVAGLAAIHEAGIIHRDISLQNVLRLADGRLVVSDFGLAVDVDETSASLLGGTVAYMSPEVALGGQASFASDVWALGIVLYELTFGRRPRWREDLWTSLRSPGRLATPVESAVFEICRACTARATSARPANGAAVLRLLDHIDAPVSRWRRVGRAVTVTLAVATIASTVWGHDIWRALRRRPPDVAWSQGANVQIAANDIPITGAPRDWTGSSQILVTVEGHVSCLNALRGGRTLRVVWGTPRQSTDIDIRTGQRTSSGLRPEVYAEGCPALSGDGGNLIFQGYDASHHGVVLLSTKPDGSEARPVVSASEPWTNGDPVWIGMTKSFAFSIDHTSVGVFDLDTHRTTVVPDTCETVNDCGWIVAGNYIYTGGSATGLSMIVRAFSWPSLTLVSAFSFRRLVNNCASDDPDVLYCGAWGNDGIIKIAPTAHLAERFGSVTDHSIANLAPVAGGMAFTAEHYEHDAWQVLPDGRRSRLTVDGTTEDVTSCGDSYLLTFRRPTSEQQIVRLSAGGRREALTFGPYDLAPSCSRVSGQWWYSRQHVVNPGLQSCRGSQCETLVPGTIYRAALAPDERRLAFVLLTRRGPRLQWIEPHGGAIHDVADVEGYCPIGWSTNRAVWVPQKRPGGLSWVEVDTDTGHSTGRSAPSTGDCSDTDPDPLSPVNPNLRIAARRVSQVRIQALP
jgi:serine/threonine protein kinase